MKKYPTLRRLALSLSVIAVGALSIVDASSAGATTVLAPSNWLEAGMPLSGPTPRYDASMVFDAATGTTLLFGGYNAAYLGDTWSWNGSVWTKLAPTTSPPALRGATMVYDAATRNVVLFGGIGPSGLSSTTWTFDGTSWTKSLATGPTPRTGAAMAYDATTHDVILFGGEGSAGPLGDTWTWNGTAWTVSVQTTPAPAARYESSMAYDAATGVIVLYGGQGTGGAISDTWTFDGTSWTKLPIASPAGRYGASMVYDATNNNLVLFGGTDGTNANAETWYWNGSYWTSVVSSTNPSARYLSSMAYNPSSGNVVLFAGIDKTVALSDTWTFDVAPSAPRNVKATSNANSQTLVTWNAPASNGGSAVLSYTAVAIDVTSTSRGGQTCATTTASTCTVTGLSNGDQYVVKVSATNALGTSVPAASNVVRPATAPDAPTITTVTAGAGQAFVSWTAPSVTGGTPVASYRVTGKPGVSFCHVPRGTTSCRIVNLRNGVHYTFTMTATNAAGTSSASAASSPVQPRTVASAPFITTTSVSGNFVTVRWTAPRSNGGVRLSGYNVYVGSHQNGAAYREPRPVPYTQLSYTFQSAKGLTVYIIVRAVNVAGIGPFSNQVMDVVK